MRRPTVLILAVAALGACGDETTPPWSGSIEVIDGVRVVSNPAVPLAGEERVTVRELWSYGGPSTGNVWHEPNAVTASATFVYVLDRPGSQVHIVGVDGTPAATVGSPGQGPGEYSELLTAAIPTPAGVFILDSGNSRIDILDESHTTVASHRMDGMAVWAMPHEEGIVAGGMFDMAMGQRVFTADGLAGEHMGPVWDSSDPEADTCTRPATIGGRPLLARCTHPDVRIFNEDGALETDIRIPIEVDLATDEDVQRRIDEAREGLTFAPPEAVDAIVDQITSGPREKPKVRAVIPDGDVLLIWDQNPENFGNGPATLYVVSHDGIFLDQLDFEDEWVDFSARDGLIYVLVPDATTGLISVRAYELDVPEGLLARAAEIG